VTGSSKHKLHFNILLVINVLENALHSQKGHKIINSCPITVNHTPLWSRWHGEERNDNNSIFIYVHCLWICRSQSHFIFNNKKWTLDEPEHDNRQPTAVYFESDTILTITVIIGRQRCCDILRSGQDCWLDIFCHERSLINWVNVG
jgi:hypothetical protein